MFFKTCDTKNICCLVISIFGLCKSVRQSSINNSWNLKKVDSKFISLRVGLSKSTQYQAIS